MRHGREEGNDAQLRHQLGFFEPIEGTIAAAAAYIGADKILWATDYPHHDGFFPGAPKTASDRLPPELRKQVMSQSAMNFYGMGRG